jgi:hypothetical protein
VVFRTPPSLCRCTQASKKVLMNLRFTANDSALPIEVRRREFRREGPLSRVGFEVQSQGPEERRPRTKKTKEKSANKTRFRPGPTGACEAQLWRFTGAAILPGDDDSEVLWVAAESLDTALRYIRLRHDDFVIKEARFLGMVPVLSGSPLD